VAAVLGVAALAVSRTGNATSSGHPVLGVALGLLAGLTYALYSWGAARMMRRGLPARPVMGAIFGLGGVLLMPVLLLTGAPIVETGRNLAVVAYLAVVPMLIGYVLFGRGLAAVSATTATTLSLLEPAVAAAIAVLVLHEGLPALGWAGMTILLAGLVVLTADTRRQEPDVANTPGARCPRCARNGAAYSLVEEELWGDATPLHRHTREEARSTSCPAAWLSGWTARRRSPSRARSCSFRGESSNRWSGSQRRSCWPIQRGWSRSPASSERRSSAGFPSS
jgi:hypothetical protein